MKYTYEKTFKKGDELEPDFEKFVMESLMEIMEVHQNGHFGHDKKATFKKDVKLTVIIE